LTYDAVAAGRTPQEIPVGARDQMKAALRQNAPRVYFDGAVRLLLKNEPDVLK